MNFKKTIINQINKLTYVRNLYKQTLNTAHPNGHFYSPVFSIEDIKKRQSEIWKNVENDGILGISLQTENQKIEVYKATIRKQERVVAKLEEVRILPSCVFFY